jgi:hypothetical protein
MHAIMIDEDAQHAIELGTGDALAFGNQGPLDHPPRPAADHAPRVVVSDRRQTFAG